MIEQLKTADHYLKAIAKFSLFFKTEEDNYDSSQSVSNDNLLEEIVTAVQQLFSMKGNNLLAPNI